MKNTYYFIAAALLLSATACHDPQYVEPTADRQGITSLTAYFTSGKYTEMELGKLQVSDPDMERYVIPIPWYYPEEQISDMPLKLLAAEIVPQLLGLRGLGPRGTSPLPLQRGWLAHG